MTYSGKFTITKADNMHYNYFRMKRKLTGLALMTFVILIALLALVRYSQGIPVSDSIFSAFLVAMIGAVFVIGLNLLSVVLRVNNLYKQGKMSDFNVLYTVDKNGVHAKSDRGDTDFSWKQITLVRETTHAFYVVISDTRASVMPKRQILNDGELAILRAMFRKYVPAKGLKIRR